MIPDFVTIVLLLVAAVGFMWVCDAKQASVVKGYAAAFFLALFLALELYRNPLTATLYALPIIDMLAVLFLPTMRRPPFGRILRDLPDGAVSLIKYVAIMFYLGDRPMQAVIIGFSVTVAELILSFVLTREGNEPAPQRDSNPLVRFANIVDRMSDGFGDISRYVVVATVVVGFANVVLRYVGQAVGQKLTSNVVIETQWYLYSAIFLLGYAYILQHQINVRVDFWFGHQSKKRKALIDFIGHLLALLPFCIIALWAIWGPVIDSWGRLPSGAWTLWEVSPDPNGLPRAPIKTFVVIAFSTLLLQALAELVKLAFVLRGREHLFDEAVAEGEAPLRIE